MLFKNKIKAIFKAIWRVLVIVVGILLVIALSLEIGVKPPLMTKRRSSSTQYELLNIINIKNCELGNFEKPEGLTNIEIDKFTNTSITIEFTFSAVKTIIFTPYITFNDFISNEGRYIIGAYFSTDKYATNFIPSNIHFRDSEENQITSFIMSENSSQITIVNINDLYPTYGVIQPTINFSRNTATSTTIKLTINLVVYSLDNYINNTQQNAYESGKNEVIDNPNNYGLYNQEQYNSAYNEGFNKGVASSSNPYSGFDNSKIDIYFYENDNETIYYSLENESISISDYNYFKLFDYIRIALSEYHSEGYTTEFIYVYIYDFQYFAPELYELLIQGFVKAVIVHDRGEEEILDIGDPNSEDKIKLELSGDVTDILLYVDPNYNLSNYNLGFSYYNNFENGYKSGYANGNKNGKNEVIDNPNKYGLYTNEQYQNYGEGKYQQGYNEGIRQEAPTGLEWFKSAISVTLSFLDIMILPGVKLIHIFSGFIILTILKWVLDWFRG